MQSKKGKIIQCHTSSISRNPHPLLWTHRATLSVLWAHQPMLFVHTIARATNVSLSHTTQFSPCLIHIIHCSPYYNSHNLMQSRVIVHHPYCPMLQILYLILPHSVYTSNDSDHLFLNSQEREPFRRTS